jgi:hypothetical protein
MTFLQSLTEWIADESEDVVILDDLQVVQMGETESLTPPFLGLSEAGAAPHESAGVVMHGVTGYDISAELHTVPADEDELGTTFEDEREMRVALYDILADRDAITATTEENGWRVFDIRTTGPTTEAEEGRRITRWQITVIACPI